MLKTRDGFRATSQLTKKHLGIAGLLTVIIQYFVGMQAQQSSVEAVQQTASAEVTKLHEQMDQLRISQEREFVRKTDLSSMSDKLDKVLDAQIAVSNKVSRIEGYLKARHPREFSFNATHP